MKQLIDQLLQSEIPSKIIKRGNAFSLVEILDSNEISLRIADIEFEDINISSVRHDSKIVIKGECYVTENNFHEYDYDFLMEISNRSPKDLTNLIIDEYLLNTAQKEIFIKAH